MTVPNRALVRLHRALLQAGLPVTGVSPIEGGGYRVTPPELQTLAQPIIDVFNPDDPAITLAEADAYADVYYRDKDVLAMCAVILEKTDTAFNTTDSNAQQRVKVVAAAVRFNQRRKWVERNYGFMVFP